MFLPASRFNTLFDFDSALNQFWDNDHDHFFSTFMKPHKLSFSKQDRLNRKLQSLKNYENDIVNNIKSYESEVEQLKNEKYQIEKQKKEISDQICKIQESQKKQENSAPKKDELSSQNENYVFKRSYYKINDMEVEEQYDSRNPEKCYKMIKKQGEKPQIIYQQQEKQGQILEENK